MAKVLSETFTLSNGVKIPALGLGTWMIPDGDAAEAVRKAVSLGYRHFDTAQAYGNERGVGEGVRSCGVPREEIFVTTKLAAEIKDYKKAVSAIDNSLKVSGLNYFDMMLIHSPAPWKDFTGNDHFFEGNIEAWRALEDALKEGKVRAIGVSNFLEEDIRNLEENCSVLPMANQVLAHISNTPFSLMDYCKGKGILVEAYSPIAHGEMLKNETVSSMAAKYGVGTPQLCIRYCLQLGMLPLPKTANPEHMASNADVDFTISEEDMEVLKGMERIRDYGQFSHFPVFSRLSDQS